MRPFIFGILLFAALLIRSCGQRPASHAEQKKEQDSTAVAREEVASDQEAESGDVAEAENAPDSGDIGEDMIALLRATKVAGSPTNTENCDQCAATADSVQVFRFNDVKVDRVSPAGETCEVDAHLFATYNPSHGGVITGGLTAWIPAAERSAYERGETPPGQQVYAVHIIYRRNLNGWQPIEFTPVSP
ncbi:MAG TPA: hypothetical protein VGC85_05605 [Chthoniobacterales bacterium]